MINIHFGITNPWYSENFKSLFERAGDITKNKSWEFQVCRYSYDIAKISVRWSFRRDHAGPSLELCLFGYGAEIKAYDCRHWDYENDCWKVYTEEK